MASKISGVVLVAIGFVVLSGCSGPSESPTSDPSPTASAPAVVEDAALPGLDGEWVATRTVVEGYDTTEQYTPGFVEDRLIQFSTDSCADACVGTVLSGATLDDRSSTDFEQAEVIEFEYAGLNDCLDVETGELLAAGGYEYTLSYELAVDETEGDSAAALSGTAVLEFLPTAAAVDAGCGNESSRVEYDVTAVRA